jgi:hypothetical protein
VQAPDADAAAASAGRAAGRPSPPADLDGERDAIPLARPVLGGYEEEAVLEVLR